MPLSVNVKPVGTPEVKKDSIVSFLQPPDMTAYDSPQPTHSDVKSLKKSHTSRNCHIPMPIAFAKYGS
jgi:hypothetical protein